MAQGWQHLEIAEAGVRFVSAYYNENDPYAAQWLRNLIAENLIAPGVVDERSILDVEAYELREFTQCHFFAGIGIWSGALRSIGWPDDEPIWTGSCPCQPFSNAGKQKGFEDERHLWPVWKELIAKCNPPRVVGEQVASKAGRVWLDSVSADLEALDFAFGASDLCAAGFEGAHLRQRIYFVGVGQSGFQSGEWGARGVHGAQEGSAGSRNTDGRHCERYSDASEISGLADDDDDAGLDGAECLNVPVNALLGRATWLAGWLTPTSNSGTGAGTSGREGGLNLQSAAAAVSGPYCIRGKLDPLTMQIGCYVEILPENQAGGPLNPEHSRWLMGFPAGWANCAPTETPSILKRRRTSVQSLRNLKVYDL